MLLSSREWGHLEKPPLKNETLALKWIAVSELSEQKQRDFERLFPQFFQEPDQKFVRRLEDYKRMGIDSEEPFNMRRFSGGTNLPRSRYTVLCAPGSGSSNQTLAAELMAYAFDERDRYFDIWDLSDKVTGNFVEDASESVRNEVAAFSGNCIVVYSRPLTLSSRQVIEGSIDLSDYVEYYVFPFRVAEISAQNILDLRDRSAMKWFLSLFWNKFPSALFLKSEDHNAPPDTVFLQGLNDEKIAEFLGALPPKLKNGALCDVETCVPTPLLSVLSFILNPSLGGTPIDDVMATILRRLGVQYLIYPSARHDCGVVYDAAGDLKGSLGWNVVNYTDIDELHEGEGYVFTNAEKLSDFSGAPEMTLSSLSLDEISIGSWMVHGLAAHQREKMLANAWQQRLRRLELVNFDFEHPATFTRTPWAGYAVGKCRRKARTFTSWLDLRIALVSGEISLTSTMEESGNVITVGSFVSSLSEKHNLWGEPALPTLFDERFWFLAQKSPTKSIRLVCPRCGDLQEDPIFYPSSFLMCYSCGAGEGTLQTFGSFELFADAVEEIAEKVVGY